MTRPTWDQLPKGCHWISQAYPQAIVSTIHDPRHPEARYVAVVNFSHIAYCATREHAQEAVEAYL